MKFNFLIGVPRGYGPDPSFADTARALGAKVTRTHDAAEAARGADVVVTDTWISMGQSHADEKLKAMMPFQVNEALMGLAKPDAKFLHCLPAHRGRSEEHTSELQSLMRISYAVLCLKTKKTTYQLITRHHT